jgi:hypothetical protein
MQQAIGQVNLRWLAEKLVSVHFRVVDVYSLCKFNKLGIDQSNVVSETCLFFI